NTNRQHKNPCRTGLSVGATMFTAKPALAVGVVYRLGDRRVRDASSTPERISSAASTVPAGSIGIMFRMSILMLDISQYMVHDPVLVQPNSSRSVMITALQLRAARALLGIDQRRLAEQSGL